VQALKSTPPDLCPTSKTSVIVRMIAIQRGEAHLPLPSPLHEVDVVGEGEQVMSKRVVLSLTVMLVTLVMVASSAWATTFTVNSTADTGDTSPDGICNSAPRHA
jgi:hypothetical protein